MTRRPACRAAFAVSFAAIAVVATVLVGYLGYDAAARLVRVDQQTSSRTLWTTCATR